MSQSLLIRAAAAATTNGELSNGQDPALASLQPRASFATESETQASLASLNRYVPCKGLVQLSAQKYCAFLPPIFALLCQRCFFARFVCIC